MHTPSTAWLPEQPKRLGAATALPVTQDNGCEYHLQRWFSAHIQVVAVVKFKHLALWKHVQSRQSIQIAYKVSSQSLHCLLLNLAFCKTVAEPTVPLWPAEQLIVRLRLGLAGDSSIGARLTNS